METHIIEYLKGRVSPRHIRHRLKQENDHSSLEFKGGFRIHWENSEILAMILFRLLRLTKTTRRGLRNAVNIQIENNILTLPNMPAQLEGFKILHLTDIHIDGLYDHGRKLQETVKNLNYDICVITGDFRFLTYGQYDECLLHTHHLVKHLNPDKPILGILGNHDSIEMVPALESFGIHMLINESRILTFNGIDIGLAGVDDSYFYHSSDVSKAMSGISDCAVKIMLGHSQNDIPLSADYGAAFYMCGHTHGGQICLPGGMAIIKNSNFSGPYIKGPWKWGNMQGYTSRGAGASSIPVRFFCPPEITLHTLTRTSS